jgi:hypothetical protein
VKKQEIVAEKDLAAFAKRCREAAGKTRAEAARELKVSHVSVHQAEEIPEKGFLNLRRRIIETYSPYKVVGPVYILENK